MPLTRCSNQSGSLADFYTEWASEKNIISSNVGKTMLEVINLINVTFLKTQIYGLTSHANLLLFSEDDWTSDWYIVIKPNSFNKYCLEYKMTKENQPWENAFVTGETNSLEKFKDFIIIAMVESQGWTESEEVNELHRQIKK
ncbi:hypothetical protein HNP37_004745 [Flavobacterium nitrogenifigens]|uniref:Uncharacterized protein n=2 Tax=Flavobacterium TaxID=237 RepID=A0A7W7N989_9FLAO|nr:MULTISPECIES: hypothetical protein [Flavobacterium]MBB4804648.1 hypothetical protein [Flavobacterium nitrogenifigens]MBB6389607.1 hypothetical protein [Flavobacterium notoginsengisoli]